MILGYSRITEHSRKAEDLSEADLDDTSQELQNLLDDKFDNIIICLNKVSDSIYETAF